MQYVSDTDRSIYLTVSKLAEMMRTALLEIFLIRTGRLFQRHCNGSFDFDKEHTTDLITGGPIEHW